MPDGPGVVCLNVLDGQTHDFVELPDGTLASLVADFEKEDGQTWAGDKIVEYARDGTEREVWSTFDTWTVEEAPSSHEAGRSWTHAYALDYDPVTDTYWVNCRNQSALLHVDRATGATLDQYGGPTPTWTFAEGSAPYAGEHQFEVLPDGLLVFDNQYLSGRTRAVEYGFDAHTRTMAERWSVAPAEGWNEQAFGDVERVDDGTTRVTFTTESTMRMYAADGTVLWSLVATDGEWLGYSDHLDALTGLPTRR